MHLNHQLKGGKKQFENLNKNVTWLKWFFE